MKLFLTFLFTSIFFLAVGQSDLERAQILFDEGELGKARLFINKSLNSSRSIDKLLLSAMIYERQDLPIRAIADFEEILKMDEDYVDANFGIGLIYFNQENYAKCVEYFSRVLSQPSSDTKSVLYATDYSGNIKIKTIQSMTGNVFQYRGISYQEIGEFQKAQEDFESAKKFGLDEEFYINRSRMHMENGREDLAKADLRTAIQFDSLNVAAWYNLLLIDSEIVPPNSLLQDEFIPMLNLHGSTELDDQNFAEAINHYNRVLNLDPENDFALLNRGKALLKIGNYNQGRKDFIKALNLNSKNLEAIYLIGNAFYHEQNYKDAILFYEQYLSLDWSNSNVWFNNAMANLSSDNTHRACQCLEKAERLELKSASGFLKKYCNQSN